MAGVWGLSADVSRVASDLEDLGSDVFEDSSNVDGSTGADTQSVTPRIEEAANTVESD